jgi:putative hydrolase of HD superfamily
VKSLWLEYEDGASPEASVARELDKLEMIIQADEYEVAQKVTLNSFFESTQDSFHHPEVNFFYHYLYTSYS